MKFIRSLSFVEPSLMFLINIYYGNAILASIFPIGFHVSSSCSDTLLQASYFYYIGILVNRIILDPFDDLGVSRLVKSNPLLINSSMISLQSFVPQSSKYTSSA